MKIKTGRRPAKARPRTKVAALLKEQGRTYVWLARETHYSKTHINAMANKRAPMSMRFLKLAADALGVEEEAIA